MEQVGYSCGALRQALQARAEELQEEPESRAQWFRRRVDQADWRVRTVLHPLVGLEESSRVEEELELVAVGHCHCGRRRGCRGDGPAVLVLKRADGVCDEQSAGVQCLSEV